MAKARKPGARRQARSAQEKSQKNALEKSLGEQLQREAHAGHGEFLAGWKEFMAELGVHGKPIGARQLRDMLLSEGVKPADNEFSKAIIAMREE